MTKQSKLLIIGIDGASHALMARYIKAGKLPELNNFSAMGKKFRPLDTVFPPHTAPGWASLFTGVNPGEHGIYQFWSLQNEDYTPQIVTVNDFGWEPLWNTLERFGMSCGLYNVPMSHPPDPQTQGFQITWPLAPTIGYMQPPHLMAELVTHNLHHKSDLVTMYRGEDDFANRACQEITARQETLTYLIKSHPCEAIFAVFTEIDRVSHYFWHSPQEPGPEILKTYQAMSRAIGEIMDSVPKETLCLIVSDHGFGHCAANIQINVVLAKAGLLSLTPAGKDHYQQQTEPQVKSAELDTAAEHNWYQDSNGNDLVDWSRTSVYMPAPGCFGLNLNLAGRQAKGILHHAAEKNKVIETLQQVIENLTDDQGQIIFDLVTADDIYQGHRLAESCDFLLIPRRGDVMAHPGIKPEIWSAPTQQAIHRSDGVFLTNGSQFHHLPDRLHITDIVPLCMAHLNLPVAEGVTGKCPYHAPHKIKQEPARRQLRTDIQNQAQLDSSEMEARLAAMGYL